VQAALVQQRIHVLRVQFQSAAITGGGLGEAPLLLQRPAQAVVPRGEFWIQLDDPLPARQGGGVVLVGVMGVGQVLPDRGIVRSQLDGTAKAGIGIEVLAQGEEFKRVRGVLLDDSPTPAAGMPAPADATTPDQKTSVPRNVPLAQSENEKARELVTVDEKFVRDIAHMPPAAATYVRRHPCLSPAMMEKWRVGVLPQDGGKDKRAWMLRGQVRGCRRQ